MTLTNAFLTACVVINAWVTVTRASSLWPLNLAAGVVIAMFLVGEWRQARRHR